MIEYARDIQQDFAYQGAILFFSHDYQPYQEGTMQLLEAQFLDLLGQVLAGHMTLHAFLVKVRSFNEMNSGLFDHTGQLTAMARNIERFFLDRYAYSDQEVLLRLRDYHHWVTLGTTKAIIPELQEYCLCTETHQRPQEPPVKADVSPSLSTDILHRMYWVIEGELMLHDFFGWLTQPLLLWEMALQGRNNPFLWQLMQGLHVYWYKYTYEDYASEDVIQQFRVLIELDPEYVFSLLHDA